MSCEVELHLNRASIVANSRTRKIVTEDLVSDLDSYFSLVGELGLRGSRRRYRNRHGGRGCLKADVARLYKRLPWRELSVSR